MLVYSNFYVAGILTRVSILCRTIPFNTHSLVQGHPHLSSRSVSQDCVDRLSVSCSDTDSDSEDEAYYSGSSMESLPTSSSQLPSHASSLSRVCWKKPGLKKSVSHWGWQHFKLVVPNPLSKGGSVNCYFFLFLFNNCL